MSSQLVKIYDLCYSNTWLEEKEKWNFFSPFTHFKRNPILRCFVASPGQIKFFFSYISSLNRFLHLGSMILYDFHSYEILLKLLDQCQQLCHFTHLNFYSCSFSKFSADPQLFKICLYLTMNFSPSNTSIIWLYTSFKTSFCIRSRFKQ
jgi:hypothetical protein